MKRYWNAFIMCQSMFCSSPCLWKKWDEEARPLMLMFLPFVGLEIGVIWALLAAAFSCFAVPQLISGAVLCLYPFFVTGFMHLDGFMDVTDAVKSWRDLERRREILKDSHVGAFAVIACGALMVMQFASSATIAGNMMDNQMKLSFAIVCLMLIPVVSRCCSGLALTFLPVMSTSQYAEGSDKFQAVVYIMLLAVAVIAGFSIAGKYGFVLVGCVAGYSAALLRAFRSLKGVNGDVAGYSLTIGELCGMIVMALL